MNPYEAPTFAPAPVPSAIPRQLFVLAATGAFLASAYWAVMTLLIGFNAANGQSSAVQAILPFVLIGLYAVRGVQIWKGDPLAARRILSLHLVGGVVSVLQAVNGHGAFAVLQGVKVAIHVFGGITAWMVVRAAGRPTR